MKFLTWLRDTAERAGSTFLVVFLPLLLNGSTINIDVATQAAIAGGAAAFSVVKGTVFPTQAFQSKFLDILSRMGWSAIQAGLAVLTAAGLGWVDITVWRGAALAGLAAAGSLIKGELADRLTDNTITPASVAPASPGGN